MDKTIETHLTITVKRHEIYCDNCGKLCDTVDEFEDGYYHNDFKFEHEIYLGGLLKIRKDLCHDCSCKLHEKIKKYLLNLGYERR